MAGALNAFEDLFQVVMLLHLSAEQPLLLLTAACAYAVVVPKISPSCLRRAFVVVVLVDTNTRRSIMAQLSQLIFD